MCLNECLPQRFATLINKRNVSKTVFQINHIIRYLVDVSNHLMWFILKTKIYLEYEPHWMVRNFDQITNYVINLKDTLKNNMDHKSLESKKEKRSVPKQLNNNIFFLCPI